MPERLQKILAQYGLASRRKAEQWIQDGRVTVNGEPAHLGQRVDLACDRIVVGDRPLTPEHRPRYHYLMLHKPLGMVSTCSDPEGRPTVLDALPPALQSVGIHPVGRLDTYSTGALLLSNDGNFTYRLTHPKHDVAKTYRVRVEGCVSRAVLSRWQRGVELEGRFTRPAQVQVVGSPTAKGTWLEITLWEGRNRQIRRVAESLGLRVLSLHRTAVGSVALGHLRSGAYRTLSSDEIKALLAESDVQPTVLNHPIQPLAGLSPY